MSRPLRVALLAGAVALAVGVAFALLPRENDGPPAPGEAAVEAREPDSKPLHDDDRKVSVEERAETLTRAQVWREPDRPISSVSFANDAAAPREVTCRFKVGKLGGTTPKFDCVREDGTEIRVKYGKGPEIPAETAATRLLRALGFGGDSVVLVERLRCYGCPEEPFSTMKAVEVTRAEPLYEQVVDYSEYEDFDWVALEQKFDARPIETDRMEGWAFFELKTIDPRAGGAPRAHVDALRLLAVFLAHWDNKPENQRLVCLTAAWKKNTPCPEPFLLIQDAGATWGPGKVDLESWTTAPIWDDRATCATSMRELPYDGATFEPVQITEGGRRMLARLLSALTDRQLAALFAGARFDQRRGLFSASHPVADWVQAFKTRRRAITEGAPCPLS
jgi:hypothetical protein